MYKLVEQLIKGKSQNEDECEDAIVITDYLIAVIDGVTSKKGKKYDGITAGKMAALVISETLKTYQDIYKKDADNIFRLINQELKNKAEHMGAEENELKASIVLYNDYYKEVWGYGDCQCIVNGIHYDHHKKVDTLMGELRAFYINELISAGVSEEELLAKDRGREQILDLLVKQSEFENVANSEFGYPELNGGEIVEKYIVRYKVSEGTEVVLASDGYPELLSSLEESERKLQDVISQDPLLYKNYKSTKGVYHGNDSYDDRTYVRFVVE